MLGYDPDHPPVNVPPVEAARVIGAEENSLAVWRCKKRYPLTYVKIGNRINYPLIPLARFVLSRTIRCN
jgi:hypothetical protein